MIDERGTEGEPRFFRLLIIGYRLSLIKMKAEPTSEPDELTFFEHLDELRARIMRMMAYWIVATCGAWFLRTPLLAILERPAQAGAKAVGIAQLPFRIFDPAGGFMLAMVISAVAGLVVVCPLLLWELWGFIKPALNQREQRWVVVMIPAATGLFLGGVLFSYWISPLFFEYLFNINKSMGVQEELTLSSYLTFMLKLLLASGLCFELPLVVMFLSFVGIVRSDWLMARWRHAVVVIAIIAAVVTPSNDPLTMTIFSIPLFFLYFLSVWLVRIIEKRRDKAQAKEAAENEREAAVVDYGENPLAYYQSLAEPSTGETPVPPGAGETPALPEPEDDPHE
jgi:sec-independent protein translocase protein TatC